MPGLHPTRRQAPDHRTGPAAGDGTRAIGATLAAYLDGLINYGGVMSVRGVADGRFLLVNPAFEQAFGLRSDEVVGRTAHELFPAEIAERFVLGDRLVLADGVARTTRETAVDASGSTRHFVAHKFLVLDPSGRPFAVGSIAVDVTALEIDRRSNRIARLDSETRFRAVFEHAPIGQIFSTMDGLITSVNGPMAAMLGYRPDEMIGRSVREYASPAEYERIKVASAQLLANEVRSASAVRRFAHRDGHEVPVRVTSALLRDEQDEPRWWVSMVVDITSEERARAELEHAHEAAVLSADRLRLLHSIATAANEAGSLAALAPRVLVTVCRHFGWSAAALLHWSDTARPAVVAAHGDLARVAAELVSPEDERIRPIGSGATLVPLPGVPSYALLVLAPAEALDDDQREVLSLVAIEVGRVIEREAAAQRVRDSEQRFRAVFDSSPLAMALCVGNSGTFTEVNNALCELFGCSREDLIGRAAHEVCHPDDRDLADRAGTVARQSPDGQHRFEMRFLHSSGAVVTTIVTLAWIDGPDGTRQLLGQMEDITARRTVEEVLRRQAEQDALTGLANRAHLGRVLCELGAAAAPCALLFIDLDGFKLINDTRGHDVGDEVLLEAAARLRGAVRPTDLVARFGGDEFVVLCDAAHGEELTVARRVAARIEASLRRPINTQNGPASITASIGIAGGIVEAEAPQELLQRADAAMYHAKRLGKDRLEVYDSTLHARALEHQRTEAALRNALDDERFVLHYQPIVDLADDSIVGFEALVRLVDETGELVSPDAFIAVAEQSGLIVPMGAWVLHESCRTIAELRGETGRPYTVSVNLAARQAARADFAETVRTALAGSGLPESALTLELTESALLEADEATLAQLEQLRDSGVVIGLDDFGTGYSSLTYLRRFPVSHLKVDRSFVAGMASSASDHAIVGAVTRLADDLQLRWIAEGVETAEQHDALAAMGNGYAQGYLFSPPVPRDRLRALVDPLERSA